MNNKSKFPLFLGLMLILAMADSAIAQENDVNVVYINGIQNMLEDMQKTENTIRIRLNDSPNHTDNAKKNFIVKHIFNPVGWYGEKDGQWDLSQDKMELFLLKTAEEYYADYFKQIVSPFNAPTPIGQDEKKAALEVTAWLNNMMPGNNSLEDDGEITADDMQGTKTAAIRLADFVKVHGSAIVVAHSQGNLLANLAYAKLVSEYGNDISKMVRVVNVANTSEFSVNGLNFAHAGDGALFKSANLTGSLENMPSQGFNWTRTTPKCPNDGACDFTIAPPTFKAQNDIDNNGTIDVLLDHSIYDTYLSEVAKVEVNDKTPPITFAPDKTTFRDRFEDFVYAAADSLLTTAPATGRLNDTGITASQCYQAGSDELVACNSTGAIALSNAQDGMVGRDANEVSNNPANGKLGFSFAAVADDCVQDNVTGLIWEVKTTDYGLRDWNKTYTNYGDKRAGDASAYVAHVNNYMALCGYTDWRLPTSYELQSIVDYGQVDPAIDGNWFPHTQSGPFWTSERVQTPGYSDYAWLVEFARGGIGWGNKWGAQSVRLVRGNSGVVNRYSYETIPYGSDASNNVVIDNLTGLRWRRCSEGQSWSGTMCDGYATEFLSLEAAFEHARLHPDWRVPNIKELSSIHEKSHYYPAIDPIAFPGVYVSRNTRLSRYWVSTPISDPGYSPTSYFWYIQFQNLDQVVATHFSGEDTSRLRLVR